MAVHGRQHAYHSPSPVRRGHANSLAHWNFPSPDFGTGPHYFLDKVGRPFGRHCAAAARKEDIDGEEDHFDWKGKKKTWIGAGSNLVRTRAHNEPAFVCNREGKGSALDQGGRTSPRGGGRASGSLRRNRQPPPPHRQTFSRGQTTDSHRSRAQGLPCRAVRIPLPCSLVEHIERLARLKSEISSSRSSDEFVTPVQCLAGTRCIRRLVRRLPQIFAPPH